MGVILVVRCFGIQSEVVCSLEHGGAHNIDTCKSAKLGGSVMYNFVPSLAQVCIAVIICES